MALQLRPLLLLLLLQTTPLPHHLRLRHTEEEEVPAAPRPPTVPMMLGLKG